MWECISCKACLIPSLTETLKWIALRVSTSIVFAIWIPFSISCTYICLYNSTSRLKFPARLTRVEKIYNTTRGANNCHILFIWVKTEPNFERGAEAPIMCKYAQNTFTSWQTYLWVCPPPTCFHCSVAFIFSGSSYGPASFSFAPWAVTDDGNPVHVYYRYIILTYGSYVKSVHCAVHAQYKKS